MNSKEVFMKLGLFFIGAGLTGIFYNVVTTKPTMELFMISHLGFMTAVICGTFLLYESERKEMKVSN